jgi:hypothetical protein
MSSARVQGKQTDEGDGTMAIHTKAFHQCRIYYLTGGFDGLILSRRAASPCERDHAKRRAEKLLYMRLETPGLKGYIATSQGEPVGEQEG